MTRPSLVRSLLALAAAATLSAQTHAQSSEAEVRADIEYARGLATDWSFVGLATEVLEDARRQNPSGKLKEELALVECEVYGQGARIERDDERRNALFHQALEQYEDFLTRYPSSEFRPRAETGLVVTAVNFSMSVDIALEALAGAAAEELTKQKIDVLERTVKRTADLIQVIVDTPAEERSAQQLQDAAALMLNRGRMLGDIGAAQESGVYFFEQAIVSLENMVFFFGEGTPQALRAYQALGDVYMQDGQVENASYMYEGVLDQSWPANPKTLAQLMKGRKDEGDPITEEEWAKRYLFLEISMAGLLDCTTQLGRTELACAYAMHFYNARQQKGLSWQKPAGYTALLACAQTLLDAGGYIGGNQTTGEAHWFATEEEMKAAVRSRRQHDTAVSFALKLANITNADNKGNYLQVRAQKLISDIASQPGVTVSVDVLVQAAEGEYNDQNFPAAIDSFKRVIATLETRDVAAQLEYGARAYNFLANAFRKSNRNLEAAMAFKAGIEANPDDLEFTEINANGYRAMIKTLADGAPQDEFLKDELQAAEDLYVKHAKGSGVDKVLYSKAEKAFRNQNWAQAISEYEKVSPDSNYAEKARVKIGECLLRGGDSSKALSVFDAYLQWVTDPANIVDSPVRKQKRSESIALAEAFKAVILYGRARKADTAEAWAALQEIAEGYPQRHPKQVKSHPLTVRHLMEACLGQDNLVGAREAVETLATDYPDSEQTAKGAALFYNALRSRQREAEGDEAIALLREMAEFLKIATSIQGPAWGRMRNESQHWMDLGEYEEAERVLSALSAEFGSDSERAQDMAAYVLPDLAEVFLLNQKVEDAKALLAPMVLDGNTKPTKRVVLNYCRSVTGWLIGGGPGSSVTEVAGAGGTDEEWQAAIDSLHRIWQRDKWECQWYEYRLMHLWAYVAWGRLDSRKMETAKSQLTSFDANFDKAGYVQIDETCEEEADPALRANLGSGILQSKFQYLRRQVR
jgi:hypothetical protein